MLFQIYFVLVLNAFISHKILAGWLALQIHIREILGINLGPKTGYSHYRGFPMFPQANTEIRAGRFLPHHSQFVIRQSVYHSTLTTIGFENGH
jgi:hypothetical protein